MSMLLFKPLSITGSVNTDPRGLGEICPLGLLSGFITDSIDDKSI